MQSQAQSAGVREYELIYVLRPNVDNAEAERVNGRVSEIVESFGGKLTKLDNWGRRRLAYPIQKHARGLFVYTKYLGGGGVVAEVERNLRITDSVLRHQTTLLNRNVDLGSVEIDPEELKFAPVEDAEPEEEIGLEQRLGLAAPPPKAARGAESDEDSDDGAEASAASASKEGVESKAKGDDDSAKAKGDDDSAKAKGDDDSAKAESEEGGDK